MAEQEKAITLSASQLKDLMVEMAREIRRPQDPTPEEVAAKKQDEQMRKDNALLQKQNAENRRWMQTVGCDHNREDGTCAAVHNQGLGFMLCQRCNGIIYPEGVKGVEYGIYDTNLFNSLFRRANASGVTF